MDKPKPPAEKTERKQRASSEPPSTSKQVYPSQAGIQKMYEVIQTAKNRNLLTPDDISKYLKAYDNFKGARKIKDEKERESVKKNNRKKICNKFIKMFINKFRK